jgi:FMN phosphatase YigB (HAD superfamily)
VLLDAGGVFLLPESQRIVAAFARAGVEVPSERLHDAHYRAAATFSTALDVDGDWVGSWQAYLRAYADECTDSAPDDEEIHRHLDSEFADAALAATGVRLGIVSNADGMIGERLRTREILQVGPGLGVEVDCVIDSGAVGVMKPDPRIFRLALDAMDVDADDAWYVGDMPGIDVVGARRAGLRPFLVDPLGLHTDAGYDRVESLQELARLVVAG